MTKNKSKKCKKGGVYLEGLIPRNGRTDAEYAQYLHRRRLPLPYQRYRLANYMEGIERPDHYIDRMRKYANDKVFNSPINDHVTPPDIPTRTPSRRRRNRTRSAPIRSKSKSKRSDMKLAIKGTYKRRRASAPVKGRMSSRKARNVIGHYKRTKKKQF